ncbi:MAG: tetratricopeptide repeat protein [Anaerolineae bacterium]|nr:tetratricopeptide repeat protein [Anaerolineae bacterium]
MTDSANRPTEQPTTAVIRTPDQRLRVFISSTLRELAAEREAARQAIEQLRLIPVLFETGARPHPPRNLYRAYLAQSHIFVGIYWQSYGWVAPDMDISGLEDELRLSPGLPKLIYIKTPAPDQEARLKTMLQQIKNADDVSYKYFSTAAELGDLIGNDLVLLLTEQFEQARLAAPPIAPETKRAHGRTTLPHPPTSLIGREDDVTAVRAMLGRPQVRLVTLTGPGGVGKTRRSLETAAGLADQFTDGIYWVNLAPITQPDLVISAIAQALDVREREGHPLLESVQAYLADKQLLLLLDNVEQVTVAAPLLADLLAAAPGLKILTTSRVSLHLRGEHGFPVQPLPVPPANSNDLAESVAVRLFVERAQAVRPDFALTAANGRVIAHIVQRLDGLPLAIELAAARLKLLPPHLILDRLNDRLKFLTSGAQDLPSRQQTMRNVIDWSYDLLSLADQTLFARLGIFVGGFTLETAEAIGNGDGRLDILEGVSSLLDNSLLQTAGIVDDQPRFIMLETVREYAQERLQENGERELLQQQHAAFFAGYALAARARLFSGESERWLDRLNADIGNFRAVLEWSSAKPSSWAAGWPLIPGLVWFTYRRGYLHEARRWCEQAIAQTASLGGTALRASILTHAGLVAMWQSDLAAAARLMDEGLEMMRRVGDEAGLLDVLFPRSVLAVNQCDAPAAHRLLAEALPLFTAAGQTWFQAMIRLHWGNVYFSQGDLAEAEAHTRAAHVLGQDIGDPWVVASAVNNFGELARYRGDYDTAVPFYRESQELFRQINSAPDLARANHSLAWVMLAQGERVQARSLFTEALALHQQLGIKRGEAECVAGLAAVLAVEGGMETAVSLFAAVYARFDQLGTTLWPADRADVERQLTAVRARLDEAAFTAAWAQGQAMPFDQAVALAWLPA